MKSLALLIILLIGGCTPSTLSVTGYREGGKETGLTYGEPYSGDSSMTGVSVTLEFDLTGGD